MNPETLTILDQISGAIDTARTVGRMVYVFKEEERWSFCGLFPKGHEDYYIVYMDGGYDRVGDVPKIGVAEWNDYLVITQPKFAPQPAKVWLAEKKESRIMTFAKKYFIGYCAFAPYLQLIMCLALNWISPINELWQFSFIVCLFCLPLSLIFALISLQRPKNSKIATMATMLASDGHMLFYGGLWVVAYHGMELIHTGIFTAGCMASFMLSGAALLLIWDNEIALSVKPDDA